MNPALIRLGILITFVWLGKYSDASPVVTLSANRSVFFTEGGSLALICELNQDVGPSSIWFKKDGLNWFWIRNSSTCEFRKAIPRDPYTYSVTCNYPQKFMLVMDGVNASDHQTIWRCEIASYINGPCFGANNPCVSKGLTVLRRVPVTTVHLTDESGQPLANPVTIVNGTSKHFRCDTSPNGSRPNATFRWYKKKENQTSTLIEDQSISSTTAPKPVPGQAERDLLISYNTLTLSVEKTYQKMNIFCAAQDKTNIGSYVQSPEAQINIVYPPVVTLLPNSSVFKVNEGSQNFSLTCLVIDANPQQQQDGFTWLHNGKVIQDKTSSSYVIERVQRCDAGQYQCEARNSYGTGISEYIVLNVQYCANITDLSVIKSDILNENGTVKIRCFVDSNPDSDITWTKEGSERSLKIDLSVLQSHLVFNSAQCLDASNYTCKASNGLGTPVERRIPLHVNCHPRTDFRSHPITKVHSKRHGDADLTYTVISYPDPTFVWTFFGNGGEKRSLPDSAAQNDGARTSTLTFTNLDVRDFGFYSITASNPLPPSATCVFELIVADVPETPSNVTIVEVTHKSVTVQWLAGQSGGPEQTFHVVASASGFTRNVYATDPGYGRFGTAVVEDLTPNTKYNIYILSNNTLLTSNMTEAIIVYSLSAENASEMKLLTVGVTAVVVVLFVVAITVFLSKRQCCSHGTCRKQGQQSNQNIELSAGMHQVNTNPVQRIEVTSEHESLQADTINDNPYLEVYDVTSDDSASENIRLPDGDVYEQLHTYANSQDQHYSSLKSTKRMKGADLLSQRHKDKKITTPPTRLQIRKTAQN